jgi:3(or 17)beta-hydroxysteroid dehydrogenase
VLVDDSSNRFGGIQILVNNAGIGNQSGRITPEETTLAQWRDMLRINGEGVFLGCRFRIEAMRQSGGAIINMASIASMIPSPPISAYGFAKAGVEQFTRSVALYCAQAGYKIRCNSVHPSQIQTPMLDGLFSKAAADYGRTPNEMKRAVLARISQGTFGSPKDVAYGVLYLASDEARHVTGTRLVID